MALWDHQCSPGLGLRGFIQTLRDPTKQPLVGILDGGCSGACRAVADISRYYNLVTVSGVAASPVLSDKYQYPMVRRRESAELEELLKAARRSSRACRHFNGMHSLPYLYLTH